MDESSHRVLASRARLAQEATNGVGGPPSIPVRSYSNAVIPRTLVDGTRGYIETIANQVNGCYERAWYDGCAVMMRRLLETLIIEAFEERGLDHVIKNSSGDFLFLRDLIVKALAEPSWNLSRNAKKALPKLKHVGDRSAHSRRFTAKRPDIDKLQDDYRVVIEEFLHLANLI